METSFTNFDIYKLLLNCYKETLFTFTKHYLLLQKKL